MPILNLPDTIEIPFDSLTNEQRNAIHTVMTGKGLDNPLSDKIDKCRAAVRKELRIIRGYELSTPAEEGGDCPTCPLSECPLLIQQQRVEIAYQLELLIYWLDALELHTDKLSGSKVEFIDNFFQRLSTAGSYTSALKSITGENKEKFSFIFRSLMGAGDNCLDRILNDFWGNCTEGTICGSIASSSGVVGMAEWVCKGQLATEVITCFLPSLINCIKKLIDEDDLNYCQARKLVEKYAASQRLTSDALTDPIIGTVIKKIFATPALTDALRELEDAELSEDFLETTQKFFPEFADDSDRNTDCVGSPLVVVGEPGIQGVSGTDGCRGPQGPPGPPGTDGSCDFENPCVTQPLGACCINGFCLEVTNSQCAFYNGSYYGDDFPCSDVDDCVLDTCGSDQDCQVDAQGNILGDGTQICCGGQCINPCPNAACGSGCPPCAPFPFPCCDGCGGNPCCEAPNICCNGSCVGACPGGGCPDCQGSCCPAGFTCCGSDGCCPDGGCCNGECCSGETPLCCEGSCSSSGNGEGCCGARACVAGEKCCGGTCVPNPDGKECCNDGPPCIDGETCCPITGCQSDTECLSSISGEVCGTISACSDEQCPQCCEGETSCDNGINCCEGDQSCCAYDASYCCDPGENCTVNCGCCDGCCKDNGQCVPPCPPEDGGGCQCGDECCGPYQECGLTCNRECLETVFPPQCCEVGEALLNGTCVQTCQNFYNRCQDNWDCTTVPDGSVCNGGCPCPDGQDCCGVETSCCDFETHECCNGQCVPKCLNYIPNIACNEQEPTLVEGCGGDCTSSGHGCCEASGGECCGSFHSPSLGCFVDGSCGSCCNDDWDENDPRCCPEGFTCCNFEQCSNPEEPARFECDYCGVGAGIGVVRDIPQSSTPQQGYSGTSCCLDGIESCTLNGCVDLEDVVWQAGGFICGGFANLCGTEEHFCHCVRLDDVTNPVGCSNSPYCKTSSIVLCGSNDPYQSCQEVCDGWSGCTRDYDPEGACCYYAGPGGCRDDLTKDQCELGTDQGVWQGADSSCADATCFSGKDEPCTNNANCEEGLECCDTEDSTCQVPADCLEPPAFGRCCATDLSCTYVIETECVGTWVKELQCPATIPSQCPPPSGCTNNASGDDVYGQCETWQDCNDPSFEPDENVGVCEDVIGACCQVDGFTPYTAPVCTPLTYPQCSAFNDTVSYPMLWKGKNTNCNDHCNCTFGTCCLETQQGQFLCTETTKSECDDTVIGVFTPCTHSTYGSGVCEGQNAHLSRCAPFGACCSFDKSCQTEYQPRCEASLVIGGLDGTFMGSGTNCNDNDFDGVADICEVPEFYCCCCDGCRQVGADGTCDIHNQGGDVCCEIIEGTCGTGGGCGNAPSLCDEPGPCDGTPSDVGACCYPDERNCEMTSQADCPPDYWRGYGTDCQFSGTCFPLSDYSACCKPDNTCSIETEVACNLVYSGEWQGIKENGDGFSCEEVNFCIEDEVGACCFCPTGPIDITPGPCTVRTQDQCDSLGNRYTFKGVGTDCGPDGCGDNTGTDRPCCPPCIPPVIGDPGGCCVCDGDGSSNGTIKCGGCGGLPGRGFLGECPGEGVPCQASCCNPNKPPCPDANEALFGNQSPKTGDDDGKSFGGGGNPSRYGGVGTRAIGNGNVGGVFSQEQGRIRKTTLKNLPVSPCGGGREFCVEENGTAKCCRIGEVCCNGDCVAADPRGVCSYSSVTEKYYYCSTGYCDSLDSQGRVVSRNSFGDRSNCPEFNGERNFKALATNSIERTYSAFSTYTDNKDIILQKNFDTQGRLDNYFIVAKSRVIVGRQNELASQTTITGINASTDRPQQTITAPVNFQIVNYVADDKIKAQTRPTGRVGGVFKTRGSTDTQSKISKAELDDNPAIGKAGYERKGTRSQTIKGSLTATLNNGVLGEAQVMTFVSGSNIRLDTNTEKSFIRINVDDLNLWELVDVDDGVSGAANDNILQYNSSEGLWKAVAVARGVTGATGATGPVGGSDKQILFNTSNGVSGSPRLKFDYSTNSLNVGAGVTANFSGGISAGATCEFNDNFVHNAKLNDYSERVTALGTISNSPYVINIENGNVQTLTVGGNFTAAFLNPPASGAAGSLTLIITNGASSTLTWPSSVKWSGGTAPSLSSSGTDIVSFTTIDAGTTWYGFVGGIGFS